jgi:hypothetical protein
MPEVDAIGETISESLEDPEGASRTQIMSPSWPLFVGPLLIQTSTARAV